MIRRNEPDDYTVIFDHYKEIPMQDGRIITAASANTRSAETPP